MNQPRMRAGRGTVLAGGAGLALAATILVSAFAGATRQDASFPHDLHRGLFPLCTGCHSGIPSGNLSAFYPSPESCANCHDGSALDRVAWSGPTDRVDNVRFSHDVHASYLADYDDPPQSCQSCHVPEGRNRMAVSANIQTGTCWSCHAHRATDHYVDANCSTCHVTLAESGLPRTRIEAFATPADHHPDAFLAGAHGVAAAETLARCATCHTADRCVSCHVDAGRPEIAALAFAPPGMDLPAGQAHYSIPANHTDHRWFAGHGDAASLQACATCHTTDDCRACHIAPVPRQVAALPARADVRAPGVRLVPHAPESHDNFFFMQVHPVLAAGDAGSCATCHVESFCVDCHDGPVGGGYHPPGFVARHAADAFGREAECSSCHDNQAFCRACHVQVGIASVGRLTSGYHKGGPVWLLRHGQAARQNLENCTTCHTQNDCTQCHGVLGAFKVSPHSPGFDARRAWEQNPRSCFACHIKNPLEGRVP